MQFSAKKLMHGNLIKHLRVHVVGNRSLVKNTNCLAFVYSENFRPNRYREFEIEVDTSVRKRTLLTSLAHEMVHIKQFATNELIDINLIGQKCMLWNKQNINVQNSDYYDLPWEIEAYGRELGLFVRWCEAMNLGKFAWTQTKV